VLDACINATNSSLLACNDKMLGLLFKVSSGRGKPSLLRLLGAFVVEVAACHRGGFALRGCQLFLHVDNNTRMVLRPQFRDFDLLTNDF
jgi:hypothetical protein